jgi:hypothetical protein
MVLVLVPLTVAIGRMTRTPDGERVPGDHQYVLWTPCPPQLLLPQS